MRNRRRCQRAAFCGKIKIRPEASREEEATRFGLIGATSFREGVLRPRIRTPGRSLLFSRSRIQASCAVVPAKVLAPPEDNCVAPVPERGRPVCGDAPMLSRHGFFALRFWRRCSSCQFRICLLGFSQGPQTRHVLTDGNSLLFDIRHCLQPLLKRNPLSVGTRHAFWGGDARLLAGHVVSRADTTKTRSTLGVERAQRLFQYIRGKGATGLRPARDSRRCSCPASCPF